MKSEIEIAQLCPTLPEPMDCSLLGSSVHGIFQARVLEWGAIAFSNVSSYGHIIWVTFNDSSAFRSEKAMAPHSSLLAWKIPWTEEPGRLQSMGSLRVGLD